MRTLQDIYVDIGRLLEEAYVLGKNETVLRVTTILNATVSVQNTTKQIQGTVKPTLIRLIREQPGVTQDELIKQTGFKFNSVRSTLYTISKKGLVKNEGGKYF